MATDQLLPFVQQLVAGQRADEWEFRTMERRLPGGKLYMQTCLKVHEKKTLLGALWETTHKDVEVMKGNEYNNLWSQDPAAGTCYYRRDRRNFHSSHFLFFFELRRCQVAFFRGHDSSCRGSLVFFYMINAEEMVTFHSSFCVCVCRFTV